MTPTRKHTLTPMITNKFWLVRHAQPRIEKGICYGQLDVAVETKANLDAARDLAVELNKGEERALQIYFSGLQRTEQFVNALQAHVPTLHCVIDERLKEMDFGHWEGQAWSDIPKDEIDRWTRDFGDYRFGGVETCNEVLERVAAAYQDCLLTLQVPTVLQLSQPSHQLEQVKQPTDIVWITHAGVIRALAYYLQHRKCKIEQAAQWPLEAPDFGAWICLDLPSQYLPPK